ncbi:hypothetical protein [Lyngbya sp. PCC 8106]|uniref:hypothetical protein n=1 Tax=Lyngbya sp. (strain PCC 8106) TaxID=313612 RepID=UPI0000EA9930|nr:hypothetical protein [Lyngbya sp. PCC 8106]EAW35133.1 hypothetical protein L8106_13500 [Lyngbya sp. PCC 8106]
MSNYPNMTVTFAGIEGKVLKSSPHGNYQVIQLSKRVVICGTFSNQWGWSEIPEDESGFTSFITYIGCKSKTEYSQLKNITQTLDGHCEELRPAKRNPNFKLEFKVRELSSQSVRELIKALR